MKRLGRFLFRVAFLSMALFLGLIVYVMTLGVPGPIVRHVAARIESSQGLRISIDRIQWAPWHHITARGIRVSVPGHGVAAAFQSLDIDIRSDPELTNVSKTVRCNMSGGHLEVAGRGARAGRTIRIVDCNLVNPQGDNPQFSVGGTLGDGWQFSIDGRIENMSSEPTKKATPLPGERMADLGARIQKLLLDLDDYDEKGLLPDVLTARATTVIDAADIRNSTACVFLEGGPVRIGDATPQPCSAAIRWTDGLVRLDGIRIGEEGADWSMDARGTVDPASWDVRADARLQAAPSEVVATGVLSTNQAELAALFGRLDVELDVRGDIRDAGKMRAAFRASSSSNETAEASIVLNHVQGSYSSGMLHLERILLSVENVAGCLPAQWAGWLSDAQISFPGSLTLSAAFEPAPLAAIQSNITGRVTCDTITYRDATLKKVSANFHLQGNDVEVSEAMAFLPGEGMPRPVSGYGTISTKGAFNMHLQTDSEPQRLAPFCPDGVAGLMASATVGGSTHIEMGISGGGPEATALALHGVVHATDVTRNDVAADLVHASFAYSNHTLQVTNLIVVLGNGHAAGSLQYDLADNLLSLDVRSTAPPKAIAWFIDPGLERIIDGYRIEGPTVIEAKGSIGLGGNPARDLRVHVEGDQIGWEWFLADHAVLDLVMDEQAMNIQNINALWCGGNVSGSMHFEMPDETNATGRCSMDFGLRKIDLPSVVNAFQVVQDRQVYEGTVSGRLILSGALGEGFMNTADGSGDLDIRDGYILSIPLFGGLSKYLSLLIPGLGFASQRDFTCSYRIRGGRVKTADAMLTGNFISIRGKGSYGFDNDLDIRVQIQFLKEGLAATVTRFLTSPLTKALEFELTGTTGKPRWRPLNTPKRLLKFFARQMEDLLPQKTKSLPDQTGPVDK